MSDPASLTKKLRYQQVLVELVQLGLPSDAAHRAILSAAALTLGVERASFWSLSDDGSAIRCVLLFSSSANDVSSGMVLERASFPAYFEALLTCRAIVACDAVTDPRTREFAAGYFDLHDIRAMLDVPVWTGGKLAGVLCFEDVGAPRDWTVDEQDFARSVANIIATNVVAAARSRAEERYRLVSRASGDVVWEWDLVTDRIEWGDRLFKTFGHPVTPESSLGQWWSDHIHPGDRESIKQSVLDAIAKGESAWKGEYRFLRHDGTYASVVDRGFLTYDDAGHALRMTGALQDVTERRALEQRVLLSDRMASLGTLAAGVAHEINNPLTYVKGNIEYVREVIAKLPGAPEDVIDALDEAIMGADRMRRIIGDLTIFTRESTDENARVDLNRVVESAVAIAQNQMRHHATVHLRLGQIPAVRGSEARLGQVAVNLLVNAAQAVRAKSGAGRITITTRTNDEGSAVLEVEDDGIGIAPEALTRLFDPFFTTKAVGEGTGLGLSITHSIVRSLGGDIHVESDRGAGATFRVVLPASSSTSSAPPAPQDCIVSGSARPRVLVVDDEPAVRSTIRRLLVPSFEVEVSESGNAALARLERERFDVVLCDLMMPDGTGVDVFETLSARAPDVAERLVFMTGGAFAAEARAFIESTTLPVVAKPIDVAELRRVVAEVAARTDQSSRVERA